jgi:hypothetical protein
VRAAHLSHDTAFEAGEVHVRAVRRVGELLLEVIATAGTTEYHHPGEARRQAFTSLPKGTLREYGLTPKVSSESQLIARLPEPEFEARLDALRAAGRLPSVLPFRRAAAGYLQPKRRRLTPTLVRLRHALADVREACRLKSEAEVSAARRSGSLSTNSSTHTRSARPWAGRRA